MKDIDLTGKEVVTIVYGIVGDGIFVAIESTESKAIKLCERFNKLCNCHYRIVKLYGLGDKK